MLTGTNSSAEPALSCSRVALNPDAREPLTPPCPPTWHPEPQVTCSTPPRNKPASPRGHSCTTPHGPLSGVEPRGPEEGTKEKRTPPRAGTCPTFSPVCIRAKGSCSEPRPSAAGGRGGEERGRPVPSGSLLSRSCSASLWGECDVKGRHLPGTPTLPTPGPWEPAARTWLPTGRLSSGPAASAARSSRSAPTSSTGSSTPHTPPRTVCAPAGREPRHLPTSKEGPSTTTLGQIKTPPSAPRHWLPTRPRHISSPKAGQHPSEETRPLAWTWHPALHFTPACPVPPSLPLTTRSRRQRHHPAPHRQPTRRDNPWCRPRDGPPAQRGQHVSPRFAPTVCGRAAHEGKQAVRGHTMLLGTQPEIVFTRHRKPKKLSSCVKYPGKGHKHVPGRTPHVKPPRAEDKSQRPNDHHREHAR